MTRRRGGARGLLAGLACLLALGCGAARAVTPAATTTVVVVRHAERSAEGGSDPGLSVEGRARAEELARMLAGADVAGVYSTQYRRTRETALPVARGAGVELSIRAIDAANASRHAADLAAEVIAAHRGRTVVVVGHSNTVPELVGALGGGEAAEMAESEYDRLHLLLIDASGRVRAFAARYGSPGR